MFGFAVLYAVLLGLSLVAVAVCPEPPEEP